MVMLEGLLVGGGICLLLYLVIRELQGNQSKGRPAVGSGRWRTAHYDLDGHTRVVVQKISPAGAHVVDEHVIAEIAVGEADYEELFLAAMARARERKAIFDSEE